MLTERLRERIVCLPEQTSAGSRRPVTSRQLCRMFNWELFPLSPAASSDLQRNELTAAAGLAASLL